MRRKSDYVSVLFVALWLGFVVWVALGGCVYKPGSVITINTGRDKAAQPGRASTQPAAQIDPFMLRMLEDLNR